MSITVQMIDLNGLEDSPTNPRKRFDEESLQQLAESIKSAGLIQPITVRKVNGHNEVIVGHRRVRAMRLAGKKKVPAFVRKMTDSAVLEAQLIENNQRSDVTPIEEARAFYSMFVDGSAKTEIAAKIGRPEKYVFNRIQLLDLNETCRDRIEDKRMTIEAGLLIVKTSPSTREEIYVRIDLIDERTKIVATHVKGMVDHYGRNLSRVPWDIDSPELLPEGAGACSACPFRSSEHPDLFQNTLDTDRCTDKTCFETRTKAHWDSLVAAAGDRVLEAKPSWDFIAKGYYIDSTDEEGNDIKDYQSLEPLVERLGVKPYFVKERYGDGYEKFFTTKDLYDALSAAGEDHLAAKFVPPDPEAIKKEMADIKAADKKKSEDEEKEITDVMQAIEDGEIKGPDLTQLLVQTLLIMCDEHTMNKVMHRRGILPEKKRKKKTKKGEPAPEPEIIVSSIDIIRDYSKTLKARKRTALLAELLGERASGGWNPAAWVPMKNAVRLLNAENRNLKMDDVVVPAGTEAPE